MVIEPNTVSQQGCTKTKPISNNELYHEDDDDSLNHLVLPKKLMLYKVLSKKEKLQAPQIFQCSMESKVSSDLP
jgi:hypothetical protein